MDVRRELDLINKHFRFHHKTAGETVVWYEFIPLGSTASVASVYDDIYDEGAPTAPAGRKYKPGVVLPVLLANENEDQKRSIPEGRQVIQTMEIFISIKDMREAGITAPYEYRPRLNDMFLYDGRYYSVHSYRVRGRLRDDVFVLVSGYEIYIDQEMPFDPGPTNVGIDNFPWPTQLPSIG